jgi:hypothetical protein
MNSGFSRLFLLSHHNPLIYCLSTRIPSRHTLIFIVAQLSFIQIVSYFFTLILSYSVLHRHHRSVVIYGRCLSTLKNTWFSVVYLVDFLVFSVYLDTSSILLLGWWFLTFRGNAVLAMGCLIMVFLVLWLHLLWAVFDIEIRASPYFFLTNIRLISMLLLNNWHYSSTAHTPIGTSFYYRATIYRYNLCLGVRRMAFVVTSSVRSCVVEDIVDRLDIISHYIASKSVLVLSYKLSSHHLSILIHRNHYLVGMNLWNLPIVYPSWVVQYLLELSWIDDILKSLVIQALGIPN